MHIYVHTNAYLLVYKCESLVHAKKHKEVKVWACFESVTPGGAEHDKIKAFHVIALSFSEYSVLISL